MSILLLFFLPVFFALMLPFSAFSAWFRRAFWILTWTRWLKAWLATRWFWVIAWIDANLALMFPLPFPILPASLLLFFYFGLYADTLLRLTQNWGLKTTLRLLVTSQLLCDSVLRTVVSLTLLQRWLSIKGLILLSTHFFWVLVLITASLNLRLVALLRCSDLLNGVKVAWLYPNVIEALGSYSRRLWWSLIIVSCHWRLELFDFLWANNIEIIVLNQYLVSILLIYGTNAKAKLVVLYRIRGGSLLLVSSRCFVEVVSVYVCV